MPSGWYGKWVLDNTLVFRFFLEFIKSYMWTLPIPTFIEQKLQAFDRGKGNATLFKKIHEDFVSLVDALLECFCADMQITVEQLLAAMKVNNFKQPMTEKGRFLLEPMAAAQDYEVFVTMMMRKNIELQLQAINLIEIICELLPVVLQIDGNKEVPEHALLQENAEIYHPSGQAAAGQERPAALNTLVNNAAVGIHNKEVLNDLNAGSVVTVTRVEDSEAPSWEKLVENTRIDVNDHENKILLQVLRESMTDFETKAAVGQELIASFQRARRKNLPEKELLEQSKSYEELLFREALKKNITATANACFECQQEKRRKKKKKATAKEAVASGSGGSSTQRSQVSQREIKLLGVRDFDDQKDIFRQQREKLIAMKRAVRQKQFALYTAATDEKTKIERPRTLRAAGGAMVGTVPQPSYSDQQILAVRHEMALKLKNNLLMQ